MLSERLAIMVSSLFLSLLQHLLHLLVKIIGLESSAPCPCKHLACLFGVKDRVLGADLCEIYHLAIKNDHEQIGTLAIFKEMVITTVRGNRDGHLWCQLSHIALKAALSGVFQFEV